MVAERRDIQRHVLPNGLVVVTETMNHVRSVSIGVWVRNGSRREVTEQNGLAHFMEHMVFKGTERRSAEAIAREMDSVGGMLDAFTSKEQICFNAKVLDENLPIAFDVIADLVLRPRFDSEDVAKEQQGTPLDWANEAHAIAKDVWVADGATLDNFYYKKAKKKLDVQLGRAGLRLARYLNDVYGSTACPVQ